MTLDEARNLVVQVNSGKPGSNAPVPWNELQALLAVLTSQTKDAIDSATAPLHERIDKLEKQISENPPLKYLGEWTEREYAPGSIVTSGGSAFYTSVYTTQKPNIGANWQIMVRRGRDGRK